MERQETHRRGAFPGAQTSLVVPHGPLALVMSVMESRPHPCTHGWFNPLTMARTSVPSAVPLGKGDQPASRPWRPRIALQWTFRKGVPCSWDIVWGNAQLCHFTKNLCINLKAPSTGLPLYHSRVCGPMSSAAFVVTNLLTVSLGWL